MHIFTSRYSDVATFTQLIQAFIINPFMLHHSHVIIIALHFIRLNTLHVTKATLSSWVTYNFTTLHWMDMYLQHTTHEYYYWYIRGVERWTNSFCDDIVVLTTSVHANVIQVYTHIIAHTYILSLTNQCLYSFVCNTPYGVGQLGLLLLLNDGWWSWIYSLGSFFNL